ncbi:MAG TPA: CoA pyrophosphatase [Anaerolineales bacterium]|nr:CoA pyrophosphatase [Anaerolineales bacterium]
MTDLPARLEKLLSSRNPAVKPEWSAVPAAVLIPLIRTETEWSVLYTRRTDSVETHRGQVSFPGGRIEAGETPVQAALREAEEELAIMPKDVVVLGQLDSLLTVTQYEVTPVVATLPWPYPLSPHPLEVAAVFHVPLPWLADPENLEEKLRQPMADGPATPVYYFRSFQGEMIWGATARITLDLLDLLRLRQGNKKERPRGRS